METIERFGYDLRVFIRVPDLGMSLNGVDPQLPLIYKQAMVWIETITRRKGELASGRPAIPKGYPVVKAAAEVTHLAPGAAVYIHITPKSNLGTSPGKVKYREQGVDELLQLKLHQAIAASDDVPDGSTIILATGDGNMGQFSEEGFLGNISPSQIYFSFTHATLKFYRSNKNCASKRLES
jgi:hypothetical protein